MKPIAFILPLALLGACDSGGDIDMKNASTSEVAKEMRKEGTAAFLNHGKWEQKVTILDIDAPGLPDEAKSATRQAMGQAQTHEVCLTPEQAKNPREDFFAGADKNCRYEHFKWGDGKIDLKLLCKHPQATQTMALTGEYQPNSYTMAMTATNEGGGPVAQMTMRMKVDARRLGACDGKEQAAS